MGWPPTFWDRIHVLWGEEAVWVDVRDFVSWVAFHVPLGQASVADEFPPDGFELSEYSAKAPSAAETHWDADAVKSWARQFYSQTDPKKLTIFQLVHQKNLTLKTIAQQFGYRGSSGPKYVLDHVTSKLQFFLRDLPWLSPDDLNEEAFSLFFDTLFALLKKNASKP